MDLARPAERGVPPASPGGRAALPVQHLKLEDPWAPSRLPVQNLQLEDPWAQSRAPPKAAHQPARGARGPP